MQVRVFFIKMKKIGQVTHTGNDYIDFFWVGFFEYVLSWVLLIWLFLEMVYSYGFLVMIMSKILNSISNNGLVKKI